MLEGLFIAQYLNDFKKITNQLPFVEIEFDDEIRPLVLLASLPNNWEAMRMVVSNFVNKMKLSYDDVWGMILAEEVQRKDFGEFFWYRYGCES